MPKEKKIPTILGLLLLLLALAAGVFLSSRPANLNSKASADCQPQNLQITNPTHNSFDLSFYTNAECSSLLQTDSRSFYRLNTSDPDQKQKLHYFQVTNLKENTNYPYSIISGSNTYQLDSYQLTTAKTPTGPIPSSNLAWGRVLNPDSTPASNAIVYLAIPGAQPLSAPVSSNGYWNISLALSFNEAKDAYFSSPPNLEEDLIVLASDASVTQITSNSSQNNPVPDIILGQDSFSSASLGQEVGSLPDTPQVSNPPSKSLDIYNPSQNNDTLNTQKPEFFGTAPQNSTIIIEVHSDQVINSQTQASADGAWSWTPPQDLEPGEHTITIKTQDPLTGIWQSVTRSFVVLAADSDSSPAFTASESAYLLSPSPTSPPAAVQSQPSSTPTPTLKPTSTPIPTSIATLTPTPSVLPQSGNPFATRLLFFFSIPLLLLSLHLFNKSAKFN